MTNFFVNDPNGATHPVEGPILFGRGSECTVRLDDAEASRKHATFYVENEYMMVRDEGSANGTFVNGIKIPGPTSLSDGDEIRIGSTSFKAHIIDAADVTPTVLVADISPKPAPSIEPPAEPAPVVAERSEITSDQPPAEKKSKLPLVLIGCGSLVVITLCVLVVVFLVSGVGFFQDLLGGIDLFSGRGDIVSYSIEEVLQEETTDDRPGVMGYLGVPDAFTISAITLDGVPVRVETWRYFAFEMRVDFVDGEATWTMDIDPAPDDSIFPAWYDPLEFELGMSPAEVAAVAASASPAGLAPEAKDLAEGGEDLAGSTLMVGDQILIGLDPSGVVYIETIALFPEGQGGS